MPKSEAFGLATQQAYATGKQPKKKGWGTVQGEIEAKTKYPDKPEYKKTAGLIARTLVSRIKKLHAPKKITDLPDPGERKEKTAMTSFEQGFVEELEKIGAYPKRYIYTPEEEKVLAKRRALLGAGVGALGGAGVGALLGHRHDPSATLGGAVAGGLGGAALGAGAGYGAGRLQAEHRKKRRAKAMAETLYSPGGPPKQWFVEAFQKTLPQAEAAARVQYGLPQVRPGLI
jgi:hypothetical protein